MVNEMSEKCLPLTYGIRIQVYDLILPINRFCLPSINTTTIKMILQPIVSILLGDRIVFLAYSMIRLENIYFGSVQSCFADTRSSHSEMFFKIGVLKNLTNFTGKHLCWSLCLIKLQTWNRCFPVKLVKFLRIAFFAEHFRWLFLSNKTSHISITVVEYLHKFTFLNNHSDLFSHDLNR